MKTIINNFTLTEDEQRIVKLLIINRILLSLKDEYITLFHDIDIENMTDYEYGYFKGMDNAIDLIEKMKMGVKYEDKN